MTKIDPSDPRFQEYLRLMEELKEKRRYNQLAEYHPDRSMPPAKKQLEFHRVGGLYRQRLLMAGNQTGKTLSGGMEIAMHLTGRYPDWWKGYRFNRATHWWAAGVTDGSTRDNPQRILLGRGRKWGTGTIPYEALVNRPTLARGIPDAVSGVQVWHKSGDISTLQFKSYNKGREKWQGETLDGVWFDEEPPSDIYDEGLTRVNRRRGLTLITFTPLMGMTDVVGRFLEPDPEDAGRAQRVVVHMTLEDATFYTEEEMREIEAQYDENMRRARVQGLPLFGEGLIYPISDDRIKIDPIKIPDHYRRIVGIDFGIGHPTACVWAAYDPDSDVVYIYDVYKEADATIATHVDAIRQRGKWIPVSWPHDGLKRDPNSGKPLAELYQKKGVRMLDRSARYDDRKGGGQAREPIIGQCLERMQTGRLRVFNTCTDWFREKSTYHRNEGKVVDYNDDLMSAMHYAVMMIRYAKPEYEIRLTQTRADSGDDSDEWFF